MTKLEQALLGVTRLCFDTAPIIYFVEHHQAYLNIMREVLHHIDTGTMFGYSSVITLTEVLVQPKKMGNAALENRYGQVLRQSRNFELISINESVAEFAADLRARYAIRTPDALQIATALSVGCQAFLTNDKQLRSIAELKMLVLDDLLP